MKFGAPAGFVYIVEASTNLVDWEKIGVATSASSGEYEFDDGKCADPPVRFYRLVLP